MSDDKNLRSKKEFKEFGCDDYFTKPFTAVMLNEIIYNMIKKSI
jgi:DNA-binding response OmpR family regulator